MRKRKGRKQGFTGFAALTIIGQKWRTRQPQIPDGKGGRFAKTSPPSFRSGRGPYPHFHDRLAMTIVGLNTAPVFYLHNIFILSKSS
jgi:hypothetical protein